MGGNVKFNNSGQNNYTKAQEKIPEGYRPVSVNTPVAVFGGETTFICYGEANGTVTMLGNPNSAYAGCAGVWRTTDPMPAWFSLTQPLLYAKFKWQDTKSFQPDAYGGGMQIVVDERNRLLHADLSGFKICWAGIPRLL